LAGLLPDAAGPATVTLQGDPAVARDVGDVPHLQELAAAEIDRRPRGDLQALAVVPAPVAEHVAEAEVGELVGEDPAGGGGGGGGGGHGGVLRSGWSPSLCAPL